MEVTPHVGFDLYVDNLLVDSAGPAMFSSQNSWLYLGDGTRGLNNDAKAEITEFKITQNSPVPEPSSIFLLGLGLIGLASFKKLKGCTDTAPGR